jgi:putative ABC transport system substrate-binding protein
MSISCGVIIPRHSDSSPLGWRAAIHGHASTGFANYEATLGGKWLELLSEIAPGLKRAAIMFNPDTAPLSTFVPSFETAARSLKVVPIVAPVHGDEEIETASITLGREPGGGLVVGPDAFTDVHRVPIVSAAARNNIPAVYFASEFVRDGGLLSYGPDRVDIFRRAATFVDRWTATVTYRRALGGWSDLICAENTKWYSGKNSAVPQADKPDF